MEEEPNKLEENWRNADGTFKEGHPDLGAGRPKGKTLKEWMRDKLLAMTVEERELFLKDVPKDLQWRMAEGNPQTDVTTAGKEIPQPIINVISTNNSDKQDTGNEAKSPDSAGGDISQ